MSCLSSGCRPDFFEGVRCALVDKGATPKWEHASVGDVAAVQLEQYFTLANNAASDDGVALDDALAAIGKTDLLLDEERGGALGSINAGEGGEEAGQAVTRALLNPSEALDTVAETEQRLWESIVSEQLSPAEKQVGESVSLCEAFLRANTGSESEGDVLEGGRERGTDGAEAEGGGSRRAGCGAICEFSTLPPAHSLRRVWQELLAEFPELGAPLTSADVSEEMAALAQQVAQHIDAEEAAAVE